MSRISPFHFNVNEYDDEELENICPRYLKWMKKVKAFDFSKRKKGKIDRTVPSFDLKYKLGENSRTPKRSKSFISKIRKGGQNLRVRVRTSADLWRRWIRGGIMYNTELNEKDELEHEEQESISPVIIKVETQPTEVPEPLEEKKSNESENNIKTEVINKTTEKLDKNKTENNETNITNNVIENLGPNSDENQIQTETKLKAETEPEKSETKETQSIAELKTTSEEISESKAKENVVKSNTTSNTSITNSSTGGMPEVIANN